MHIADALISPPVAVVTGAVALALIGIASKKVKESPRPDIVPLMGVMGAFIFAAQMINFSIPGTGSSGHLIGGVLLSAMLGPWCAFLTLCSILIVQCFFFADGGMLALGCNILNMAAFSCLIAYPLVYKPVAGNSLKPFRIISGSILASVAGLELGALAVTAETELSGITALPFSIFLKFMLPIHFVIGLVEGVATAVLLLFVARYSPSVLEGNNPPQAGKRAALRPLLLSFGGIAVLLAALFTFIASDNPDGLEWSVEKTSGMSDLPSVTPPTAFMPDYNSGFAGIIGSLIVVALIWAVSALIFSKVRKSPENL